MRHLPLFMRRLQVPLALDRCLQLSPCPFRVRSSSKSKRLFRPWMEHCIRASLVSWNCNAFKRQRLISFVAHYICRPRRRSGRCVRVSGSLASACGLRIIDCAPCGHAATRVHLSSPQCLRCASYSPPSRDRCSILFTAYVTGRRPVSCNMLTHRIWGYQVVFAGPHRTSHSQR